MKKEEIVEVVKQYVKSVCENETTGHDWTHIQRVCNNAILINEKENADEFVVLMISLLHDLYDHKFFKGDIEAKLNETLKELKVYDFIDKNDLKNITYSCANLGFSSNLDTKKELSLEGKIAQDADRLDALGAIGVMRTLIYTAKIDRPVYIPGEKQEVSDEEYKKSGSKSAIGHFYDKLFKIKDLMNTKSAKEVAEERHKFLELYVQEFLDEWNGKK